MANVKSKLCFRCPYCKGNEMRECEGRIKIKISYCCQIYCRFCCSCRIYCKSISVRRWGWRFLRFYSHFLTKNNYRSRDLIFTRGFRLQVVKCYQYLTTIDFSTIRNGIVSSFYKFLPAQCFGSVNGRCFASITLTVNCSSAKLYASEHWTSPGDFDA